MSVTEKFLIVFLPSREFEYQTPVITLPSDFKETFSPRKSFSDVSQKKTTPFTEVKNPLHGSNTSPHDHTNNQEASDSSTTVRIYPKILQKK